MDTGSFNSSDGDINAVMDESHNVSIVKNGSKLISVYYTYVTQRSYSGQPTLVCD